MDCEAEYHVEGAQPAPDNLLFDAELRPHRSLSPLGFLLLMVAIGLISFAAGLGFFLAGAWPVVGFLGADVLLVYVAFKISFRRGQLRETLQLSAEELLVQRVSPWGTAQSWRFQPYWLQVGIEEDGSRRGALVLRSHGKSLALGKFLTCEERGDVARALRQAIRTAQQPN